MTKTLLTSALILGSVVASQAAMVTLTNADFELPGSPDNSWSNTKPTGWTATNAGIQDRDPAVGVINTVVFLQGGSSLIQEISADLAIGAAVAIGDTFDFSILALNANSSAWIGFDIQDNLGASLIGGFQDVAITTSYSTIPISGTVDTASTSVFLAIRNNQGSAVSSQALIDDVTLDYTPVPEPSSAALLGLGGLALILRRRK